MSYSAVDLWHAAGTALPGTFRSIPEHDIRLRPGAFCILSGLPYADFNLVYIGESPESEQNLQEFTSILQRRELPGIVIIAASHNGALDSLARDAELTQVGTIPLMSLMSRPADTELPIPAGFEIERVTTPESLEVSRALFADAFGFPIEVVREVVRDSVLDMRDYEIFVAWRDGVPMSAVSVTKTGPIVGIWSMATPPEHQRKGAARAVLHHVMNEHTKRSAKVFYLGATPAGKPLYDAVGFTTVAEDAVWLSGASTQFPEH